MIDAPTEDIEPSQPDVEALAVKIAAVLAKVEELQRRAEANAAWEQEWRELRRREVAALEKQAEALTQISAAITVYARTP